MKVKIRSKKLSVARKMPERRHREIGEDFDIAKSEVIQWIASQPDLLLFVFDQLQNHEIIYDPELNEWRGIDLYEA